MERDTIKLECLKLAVSIKGLYQVVDYLETAKLFEQWVSYNGYLNASGKSETVPVHADEPKRGRPKGSGKLRQEAGPSGSGIGVCEQDKLPFDAPDSV